MNKKTNLMLIGCVLSIILLFSSTGFAWLDGFDSRKPITINSTTNISEYQKILQINYTANMQSNFADIRFTDMSDNNLSYWIEDQNDGINATVWVKTNVNTTSIIYMYYSNTTSISSESNGEATFILFDNYDDNSLNSSKWTSYIDGGASISESGGILTLTTASTSFTGSGVYTTDTFTKEPLIMETQIQNSRDTNPGCGGADCGFSGFYFRHETNYRETSYYGTQNQYYIGDWFLQTTTQTQAIEAETSENFVQYPFTHSVNTWYDVSFRINTDSFKLIVDDSTIFDKTYTTNAYSTIGTNIKFEFYNSNSAQTGTQKMDNTTIRKYTPTEPTYTVGAEESNNDPVEINITSPTNTIYYTSSISVNININETDSTSFSCNISEDGTFLTEITINTTYTDTLTKSVGTHNISVSCEDSDNQTSSATTHYYINTQPTVLNLTSNPTTIRYAQNITFNCSGYDADGDNLTAYYRILDNNLSIYLMNWTTTNYYTFAYEDVPHFIYISCMVDDGYINSTITLLPKEIHRILNITALDKNNNSINNFSATIKYIYPLHGSISGDPYNTIIQNTTTGYIEFLVDDKLYNITIDAPGYEFKNDTINISNIHTYYNFSLYTTNSISFIFKDEDSGAIVDDRNITIELISLAFSSNYSISDGTLYVDVLSPTEYTIRYSAEGYSERFYYFNLGNRTHTDLTLYLINATTSSDVTATVYDQNNNLLENVYIKVLRYDINTNSYLIQEIVKTNFEGVGALHIVLHDEFYRFILEYDGEVVDETTPSYIYATTITFQVLLGSNYAETFYNINDINYYLTFNNDTNNFRYTFSDTNNIVSAGCLQVQRVSLMGYQNTSTSCVNLSSGTILIGVTNTSGVTYKATGYVYFGDEEVYLISYLHKFVTEELSSDSGLFYVVLLMILFAFVGIWSPAVAVILTPLALIFGELIGLIHVGMMYLMPIEILAIIIAYMINEKG